VRTFETELSSSIVGGESITTLEEITPTWDYWLLSGSCVCIVFLFPFKVTNLIVTGWGWWISPV
jgi:hypothetical protein